MRSSQWIPVSMFAELVVGVKPVLTLRNLRETRYEWPLKIPPQNAQQNPPEESANTIWHRCPQFSMPFVPRAAINPGSQFGYKGRAS